VLLLSAIEVILRAPGPSRAHCCLLHTRHSGSLCPLSPVFRKRTETYWQFL